MAYCQVALNHTAACRIMPYAHLHHDSIHIELTDKNGKVTKVDKPMPIPDYTNWTNTSAYAMYIRRYGEGDNYGNGSDYEGSNVFEDANSKNDIQKEFKTITISPLGDDPNIQILGLVVSGTDN